MRTLIFIALVSCGCSKKESGDVIARPGDAATIKPVEGKEALEWTHKELREHLESKGLKYVMFSTSRNVPAAFFAQSGTRAATVWAAEEYFKTRQPEVFLVQLQQTPQEAREMSGPEGDQGFSWGRFLFLGNANTLKSIKTSLP
jgi:hypothetical protein